jgi:enoyl-[acyl-carrier protein] reductase II
MSNVICEALGIRYPIILGGMATVGTAPLAAAVSEAGGFGILGSSGWTRDELSTQIKRVRELTDKNFGVNIPVIARDFEAKLKVIIDQGVSIIATSAGDPHRYTALIKDHGIYVMHVSPTVEYALVAEEAGVDAIVAEGSESGGMTGPWEISTLVLVPQVVDAVNCPVIAAGGIGDGRSLAAALALGAAGVQMGTVFMATEECEMPRAHKEMLVMAQETATTLTRYERGSERHMKQEVFERAKGILKEEQPELIQEMQSYGGEATLSMGQVAGMIGTIRPVREIIESMIRDAKEAMASVSDRLPPL